MMLQRIPAGKCTAVGSPGAEDRTGQIIPVARLLAYLLHLQHCCALVPQSPAVSSAGIDHHRSINLSAIAASAEASRIRRMIATLRICMRLAGCAGVA